MRIRFYPSPKRRKRIPAQQKWILAGSVFLLLLCGAGIIRYAVNARRSAQINQTFQELYAATAGTQAQRGGIIRQYEVVFFKANAEENATTAQPKISNWPGNPSMTISPQLKKLQRQNKDIVGWLSIPDMLAQAVVQRDNTY